MRRRAQTSLRLLLAALALSWAGAAAAQEAPLGPVTPAEVAAAIPAVVAELPLRIDEITQVVGVRAQGTEFVYEVAISQPIPAEMVAQIRQDFQAQSQARLCSDADVAAFFRRGGGMRHRYSDTTGFLFETRVTACP